MKYFGIIALALMLANFGQSQGTADEIRTCPPTDLAPKKLALIKSLKTPLVDKSREINDFSTAIVVKEFFKTKDTLFNFSRLVYETIDRALANYRKENDLEDDAIVLIAKGGNVLRIIGNGGINESIPKASELLREAFGDVIKRSDSDYSVLTDESKLNGLDYDEVLSDLTDITYEALNDIRKEFTKHPKKYFDFMRLSPTLAQKTLKGYFDQLKDLTSLSDPENKSWYKAKFVQLQLLDDRAMDQPDCHYEGALDVLHDLDPKNPLKIIGTRLTDKPTWIANTINRTLEWPTDANPDLTVAFDLVRAKLQFEYTYLKDGKLYRKPFGGELVDVSFLLKEDFRAKDFFRNLKEWIANYTLTNDDGEVFKFKAESIAGITADLYDVLWVQHYPPWQDAKYEKRTKRLFLLGIMEMMSTWGTGAKQTAEYVKTVRDSIIDKLASLYPISPKSKTIANNIRKSAQILEKEYPEVSAINHIWQGMGKVAEELVNKPKKDNEENLKKFIKILETNLDVVEKLGDMKPSTIDPRKVYNATIDSYI